MREIKFRAWDKSRGCYFDKTWCMYSNDLWSWTDGDFELEQYTGLKDRNGKEIYEGDIVRDYPDVGEVMIGSPGDMTINCSEYNLSYYGVYLNLTDTDVEFRCDFDRWEVIGNIHENPELVNT